MIESSANDGQRVQSVDRVVSLLEVLTDAQGSMGVGEISRQVGLSKGTVHRLLGALQVHRLVEQDDETKQYRLGFRLAEFGNEVIRQLDRPRLAQQHLQALVDATSETAHLAMLSGGQVYYTAKVEGSRALRMPSQVGASNPVHCTAVGKAILAALESDEVLALLAGHRLERHTPNTITDRNELLAELEAIRRRGYAVDNEELEEGLRCIAAGVTDHTEKTVAAVSVSGPAGRIKAEGRDHTRIAGLVVEAAEAISREFGGVRRNN